MHAIVSVDRLSKHFRVRKRFEGPMAALRNSLTLQHDTVRAVDDVSFQVQPGELVGYLGPNGAGKSTTLKMLTGLLVPTGGTLEVNGALPWRDRRRYVARIGAVFGQRTSLWWDLPVVESFRLLRHIYDIPGDRFEQNLTRFRDLLDMDAFLATPVRSLSLGQRMRADLCAALLHDPVILFLDEPTIGLDVVARQRIREFISHINRARGTTVMLTTHDLSDVEKLCERVIIIDDGKLLYDGALAALKTQFGGQRSLVVDYAEHYPMPQVDGATIRSTDGLRVTYGFEAGAVTASTLIGRLSRRYRIRDLAVHEPDIEDTVRRIYEERLLAHPLR